MGEDVNGYECVRKELVSSHKINSHKINSHKINSIFCYIEYTSDVAEASDQWHS